MTTRGKLVRSLAQRLPAQVALLGTATFALSLLAVELRPSGATTAVWWPAAAVSVGALLLVGPRHRTALVVTVLVSTAAANLVGGRDLAVAAGFGLSNAVEAWVVAWVFTRGAAGRAVLRSLEDFGRLVAAGLAGSVAAGAVAGATAAALAGADGLATATAVAFAHASAVLLLVPPLLLRRPLVRPPAGVAEAVAQWGLALAVTVVVFAPGQHLPLAFLPLPVLVWAATRASVRTTSLQVLLVGLCVSVVTLAGGGPFATSATDDPTAAVPLVQLFLLSYVMVLLPLAMAVHQRRESVARLRVSEEVFRTAFEEALVGMLVLRHVPDAEAPLRIVRANEVAARILGVAVDELPGTPFCQFVAASEQHVLHRAVEDMLSHSFGAWHGELRHVVGGQQRWTETALTRLPGTTGAVVVSAQLVDVTDRRTTQQRLQELAMHDSLTGLPNRLLLAQRVDEALAGRDEDDCAALLFCDLDDFKVVNDTAGHAAGDELLVQVARRLEACVRNGDTVARLGGDEFVMFCPGRQSRESAGDVARRVIEAVRHPFATSGTEHRVGVSVGVALLPGGSTLDTAMRRADVAMYLSKTRGKNQVTHFDADVDPLARPARPVSVA